MGHRNRKCLVLDLDETLVHSSFRKVKDADFLEPVEIDNYNHTVYVRKRPHTDEFLERMAEHYEIVLFTASLSKYANPLLDMLDTKKTITHRLYRESCVHDQYCYVKDLSLLGRKLTDTIIVDNSPQSFNYQPRNAVPIPSWFDDQNDTDLKDLIPVLQKLKDVPDVRRILDGKTKSYEWLLNEYGNGSSQSLRSNGRMT